MYGLEIELIVLRLNAIIKLGQESIAFLFHNQKSSLNYRLGLPQILFDQFSIPLFLILKIRILWSLERKKVSKLMAQHLEYTLNNNKKSKMRLYDIKMDHSARRFKDLVTIQPLMIHHFIIQINWVKK